MTVPPRIRVAFALPPVKFAEPPVMVRSPSVIFEVNEPFENVVRPVTFPPVRLVFPSRIFSVVIEPQDMNELPEESKVPIVPL